MSLPSRLGTSKRSISHLLLAGHNSLSGATSAAPSHPTLTPIPFGAWLGSIGRAEDVHNGWRLLPSALASGQGHSLIGYRSLGVDRCFGVGRNESAQLGVGFASQEGTRGLVEGFEVSKLVVKLAGVGLTVVVRRARRFWRQRGRARAATSSYGRKVSRLLNPHCHPHPHPHIANITWLSTQNVTRCIPSVRLLAVVLASLASSR